MNKRVLFALLALVVSAAIAASCGGDNGTGGDSGQDGTLGDGGNTSDACWSNCGDGGCTSLGITCSSNTDCCSGNCANGSCQPGKCTSDNQPCSATTAPCCSGTCGSGGTCTPLPCGTGTGKTLGNACTQNSDCCSNYCVGGICGQPSYCGQNGDICEHNTDCCGGICNIAQGKTFGTCGQPPPSAAQCSLLDGMLCASSQNGDAGFMDSGLPKCGGACCSRDCAPYGPTNVLICQPASGCKPVGDVCNTTNNCCGGNGGGKNDASVTTCSATDGGVGVCSNPTGCKPRGDICRLQTNQCNATDECCTGNVQQFNTCKQDNLGVPRCSYAGDAGCIPPDAGGQCSSSADCCNLNPCVPDGKGGFTCYPQNCVPVTGACTSDGDCCPGGHCYIPGGQTSGTCQPPISDAGSTCDAGLYGQTCTTSADCCYGVPCTAGRCEVPVN